MALGLELWMALRWHSVHWKPLSWRSLTEWHFLHVDLGGLGCLAWYLPPWQVRQLFTDLLTFLACSALLWQPLQTNFFVTDEECCAVRPDVPLWHCLHLVWATFLPACLLVWQEPHFLNPGLPAWFRWNACALVWHLTQETLPACLWGDEWHAPHWSNPVS
jgi:hypothetical protein